MSELVTQLVRVGIFPMLEPLGFAVKGLNLTRKTKDGPVHQIRFVSEELTPERSKFYIELAFQERAKPETTVRLASLIGKKDGWWVVDQASNPKLLSERLLVAILQAGMGWLEG